MKAARRAFEEFPVKAQISVLTALEIVVEGRKPPIAKPLKGFESGIFEIALPFRGDAFRVVQIGDDVWVLHAFKKKSTEGIKTPKHEIDLVRQRLRQLKEMLE